MFVTVQLTTQNVNVNALALCVRSKTTKKVLWCDGVLQTWMLIELFNVGNSVPWQMMFKILITFHFSLGLTYQLITFFCYTLHITQNTHRSTVCRTFTDVYDRYRFCFARPVWSLPRRWYSCSNSNRTYLLV